MAGAKRGGWRLRHGSRRATLERGARVLDGMVAFGIRRRVGSDRQFGAGRSIASCRVRSATVRRGRDRSGQASAPSGTASGLSQRRRGVDGFRRGRGWPTGFPGARRGQSRAHAARHRARRARCRARPSVTPGRQIAWMDGEAGAAHLDRLGVLPGAAVLLGELRECNRRRVLLDPASEVLNTRIVGHARPSISPTVIICVVLARWPRSSVTVSVTEYVPRQPSRDPRPDSR